MSAREYELQLWCRACARAIGATAIDRQAAMEMREHTFGTGLAIELHEESEEHARALAADARWKTGLVPGSYAWWAAHSTWERTP